jgi:Dullard-like phosphatase family protein
MHANFYSSELIQRKISTRKCLSKERLIAQKVRPTRESQFKSNPFSHSPKKCLFDGVLIHEFRNYKVLSNGEEPEHELSSCHPSLSIKIIDQMLAQNELEEMENELNDANSITYDIARDLREISNITQITDAEYKSKSVTLPPRKHFKNTIFLDLDETLIHSITPTTAYKCSQRIIHVNDHASIYIRPGLMKFISKLHQQFELILLTAADKDYTDPILNTIDPLNLISYRFYRDSCILRGTKHIKDLRIFSNRDIKSCIIIDNSVVSFLSQLDNGIPIVSFYGSSQDNELYDILQFLTQISNTDDVRPHLQKKYALSQNYQQINKNQHYNNNLN